MAIKFKNEEHENRYCEILTRMGSTDEYHRSAAYLLALDTDCYKHIDSLYDFKEHGIKPWGVLNQAWQTGTSVKTTRLIFNLWNTRCYDLDDDSREVKESARKYTVDEIFSSSLAFWYFEAVKLRYPHIETDVEFNCDYCPNCGAKMDGETDQNNTGRDIKPNKDCSRCLAYNIDHCTAKECKGAVIVLRHSQARRLPDEVIQKYYEAIIKPNRKEDQ